MQVITKTKHVSQHVNTILFYSYIISGSRGGKKNNVSPKTGMKRTRLTKVVKQD